MFKYITTCLCAMLLFTACGDDSKVTEPGAPISATETTTQDNQDARERVKEKMKGEAILENDLPARAKRGMDKLFYYYKEAAETIDGFDNPSYTMDDKCNVVYTYEERGTTFEKRFNIGDLEHRNGRMSLEADNGDDVPFPGFRIATADGDANVLVYKDGKQVQKDNEWYVVLADRSAVEATAPTMVSVINICQEIKKEAGQ